MKQRPVAARAAVAVLVAAIAAAGCASSPGSEDHDRRPAAVADTAYLAHGTIGTFGDTAGEARSLAAIVMANAGGGQRVVLTFADAGGLPANTVGPGRVQLLRDLGVVRVWLPAEVDAGAMTQTFWAGDIASDAFLVRSIDGGCFVDVHLRVPAVARVWETALPAALVLDLRPGGDPIPERALRNSQVVLLAPRGGPASYPLEIGGYARTFEGTVVLRMMQHGKSVRDTFTTATDYVYMWGEFRLVLPAGPSGPFELQAGQGNMETGAWEGVGVPIEVR
jgi:hypothetical protein